MLFILYSEIDAASIGSSLGMPEYSYYFVLRGFRRVLETLGEIRIVQNPASEVDPIYRESVRRGQRCVFLSFSPPNKTLTSLSCPSVCVFAWEFSNIPYEVWDDDPRHDWRTVFAKLSSAITLSTYTEQVVKRVMGADFPISAIPVPISIPALGVRQQPPLVARSLPVAGTVIDSRFYEVGAATFTARIPPQYFQARQWHGERIEFNFELGSEESGYVGGFYEPESWGGVWSRIASPWIMLPFSLLGRCRVGIELTAYGPNVDATILLSVAQQSMPLPLAGDFVEREFVFDVGVPTNLIQFSGIDISGLPDARDPRSMGIGLRKVWIERIGPDPVPAAAAEVARQPLQLQLEGVVYSSVLNPGDDRKNWLEMLTAFCYAFHAEPRAVLILKMTHRAVGPVLERFHYMLQRIGTVQCRVLILHGYLDDDAYQQLIDISTYCVNSSRCEGLCLPLMEFMSHGVPAVAPDHTAMQDYLNEDNAFVVASSLEPGIWPHDSRDLMRTLRYRINWQSLVDAYRESFRVATEDAARYRQMSLAAQTALRDFSGDDVVRQKLHDFFSSGAVAAAIDQTSSPVAQ